MLIVLTGATGTGKTRNVREIITGMNRPKFGFDIDGEWKGVLNYSYTDEDMFIEAVAEVRGCVVLCEEAPLLFEHFSAGKNAKRFKKLLVTNRKQRRDNVIILNFHTARQVPKWILGYCDYWIMRYTIADNLDTFKEYPFIIEANEWLQTQPAIVCPDNMERVLSSAIVSPQRGQWEGVPVHSI